jgi:hypothetical protein
MLEFYSDLRQVGGFLWLPPPIKTEILLKVALNTFEKFSIEHLISSFM